MSLATEVANLTNKVNDFMDLVKGQYNKWDGEVKAKVEELESWRASYFGQNEISGTVTEDGYVTVEFSASNAFVTIRSDRGHLDKTFFVKQHCCGLSTPVLSEVNTYDTRCELVRSDENKYWVKASFDLSTQTEVKEDGTSYNDYTIKITKIKDL